MAPRYMSDHVKLLFRVLLMYVISTANTGQCTPKKTERDGYVMRNIGIKLCHLKCAEHGECASIEYDIETLTCRLLRDESKDEKKEGNVPAKSNSHDPTDSCTSGTCSFGQRCLKTRSGKKVCVQASTDPKPNTAPPASVTTQDSDPLVSTSEMDPLATVTQNCDPHATPSPAALSLYFASMDGDLEKVKQILEAGHVDINTRLGSEETPVMAAARNGKSDVVKLLVGRGADVLLVDRRGSNVLHFASRRGDLETVKLILSLDVVDINSREYIGMTPVMEAAWKGHRDVLEFLVGRGADVSLVTKHNDNVLHYAGRGGDLETVKLILSLDVVDINAKDKFEMTAADLARRERHQRVLDLLVSHGAH